MKIRSEFFAQLMTDRQTDKRRLGGGKNVRFMAMGASDEVTYFTDANNMT